METIWGYTKEDLKQALMRSREYQNIYDACEDAVLRLEKALKDEDCRWAGIVFQDIVSDIEEKQIEACKIAFAEGIAFAKQFLRKDIC